MCRRRVVLSWVACLAVTGVSAEQVLLKGGSRVDAPLVKRDARMTVLDLGFDVLRVPNEEILQIMEDAVAGADAPAVSSDRIYTMRQAERMTTSAASSRFAASVVLVRTAGGQGSGFFVSTKGYLLTNFHVVSGEKNVSVTQYVQDGAVLKREIYKEVEIIATAPFHDLAVLRVTDLRHAVEPVVFAPDDAVSVGETVFAIGNPMGLERTVTEGVLSQTARLFEGILYLQLDAPVNPGNSGGPVFNSRGQVIGVINMGAAWMEGLNFAIPARHAKYVLDNLSAFAYDPSNSTSGFVYPAPPRHHRSGKAAEVAAGEEK